MSHSLFKPMFAAGGALAVLAAVLVLPDQSVQAQQGVKTHTCCSGTLRFSPIGVAPSRGAQLIVTNDSSRPAQVRIKVRDAESGDPLGSANRSLDAGKGVLLDMFGTFGTRRRLIAAQVQFQTRGGSRGSPLIGASLEIVDPLTGETIRSFTPDIGSSRGE